MDTNRYETLVYADRGRGPVGYDCWGLFWLVYRQELGIDLPSYSDEYPDSDARGPISDLIDQQIQLWTPVDIPEPYDLVLFKVFGKRMHCGLALNAREFLHCFRHIGVSIERFNDKSWSRRIDGFYRHRSLI